MTHILYGYGGNRRVVKELACQTCRGTGSVSKHTSTPNTCLHCGGRGQITVREDNGVYEYDTTCPYCHNSGGTSTYTLERCKDCNGTGFAKQG